MQEYSTPTVNPEGQKMAAHMAGELKTVKDSSCLQKKHRHATVTEKKEHRRRRITYPQVVFALQYGTVLSDATEARVCL